MRHLFSKRKAGRKVEQQLDPESKRSRVSHQTRDKQAPLFLITMKLRPGLPSLRTKRIWRALEPALRAGKNRFELGVLHFSILSNHIHLVVEPSDPRQLSRGMQGLAIRIAKALNRAWRRKGTVFADRFHSRVLKKVNEVYRAVRYVLQNARKHRIPVPAGQPDFYSSGRWFRGWIDFQPAALIDPPVVLPKTGLSMISLNKRLMTSELPGTRHISAAS